MVYGRNGCCQKLLVKCQLAVSEIDVLHLRRFRERHHKNNSRPTIRKGIRRPLFTCPTPGSSWSWVGCAAAPRSSMRVSRESRRASSLAVRGWSAGTRRRIADRPRFSPTRGWDGRRKEEDGRSPKVLADKGMIGRREEEAGRPSEVLAGEGMERPAARVPLRRGDGPSALLSQSAYLHLDPRLIPFLAFSCPKLFPPSPSSSAPPVACALMVLSDQLLRSGRVADII